MYCRRRQLLRAVSGMPGAGAVRYPLRLGLDGGVRRHVHRRPHHRQRQEPGAPRAGPELVSITSNSDPYFFRDLINSRLL